MATTKSVVWRMGDQSERTSFNGSATNRTGDGNGDDYYDYDVSDHALPLGELIPVALVYGLTLTLGMIGNLLVIVVVARYRSMKNITNTFLLSLASADLLLVCICIPIKFAAFFSFSWTFGEFLCRGVSYLQNVSALCSVLTLMVMSAERYYAILHPMRAKYVCTVGRARRAIFILWVVSLVLAMPIVFQTIHREVGNRHHAYWCVKNWEDTVHSMLYELYMLLVMLVLPLSVMTFAYVGICYELWVMSSVRSAIATRGCSNGTDHQGSRLDSFSKKTSHCGSKGSSGHGRHTRYTFRSSASQPSSVCSSPYRDHTERSPVLRAIRSDNPHPDDDRTRKQVIKMLVFVIVVFVICWAPLLVSNVLTAFGILHPLNYGYLKPMRQVFYLLAYANSCVNPLIYGFMSRHFRQTFLHAICTCVKGREYTQTLFLKRQNSFQTRSTNMGYSNDGSDLELTTVENPCGNCVGSAV